MKFTNRFAALILVVVMIFSMISCGKKTWNERLEALEKLKRNDLKEYEDYDVKELNEMLSGDHHLNIFFTFSKDCFPDVPDTTGLPRREARLKTKPYYDQRGAEVAEQVGLTELSDIHIMAQNGYVRKNYRSFDAFITDLSLYEAILEHDEIEGLVIDFIEYTVQAEGARSTYDSVTPYTETAILDDIDHIYNNYLGSGMKVGMIDVSLPIFDQEDSIAYEGHPDSVAFWSENESSETDAMNHAATTMKIIDFFAPDVAFYCVGIKNQQGNVLLEIWQALEWLIQTKDVDIINMSMSYGESTASGYYSRLSACIDYWTEFAGIPVIISSGNKESDNSLYIPTSSCSANAIVVGASNAEKNVWCDSCYNLHTIGLAKPDLVAPGENISSIGDGTSWAAPIVTGLAVKLMSEFPTINNNSDYGALKAALMAGCTPLNGQTSLFDPYCGAGLVNYQNTRAILSAGHYNTVEFPEGDLPYASWTLSTPNICNVITYVIPRSVGLESSNYTDMYQTYSEFPDATYSYTLQKGTGAIVPVNSGYQSFLSVEPDFTISATFVSGFSHASPEFISIAYRLVPHEHSYGNGSIPYSELYHRTYCACLQSYIQGTHTYALDPATGKNLCTVCGYDGVSTIQPWRIPTELEIR